MHNKALSFFGTLYFVLLASPALASISYTDIVLSPDSYLGETVTMRGSFFTHNAERQSFKIKQGDHYVEVFFRNLHREVQAGILNEENFSNRTVTVTGVLRRFRNTENSYYIDAQSIMGIARVQVMSDSNNVRYTDIVLSPDSYLGETVTMRGSFFTHNAERQSFKFKQGDHYIEVFFRDLQRADQARILNEGNFSNRHVTVTGELRRFRNADHSYYVNATSVAF